MSPGAGRAARLGRAAGLAVCALLIGNQSLQNAAANGDTRTISFHHLHTGENLTVTYKREGRYDDGALKQINHVMRDWRRNEEVRMDPRVIDIIWEVHREVGGKQAIDIICGYRAPATNQMLRRRSRGVAQTSQHTVGKAVDFTIPGVSLEAVRIAGLRLQRGGVGFYPSSNFVHLDIGSVRHWPRMTHDQLARVFPNGRTVHVPSDGRPLAGYALALADLEKRGSSPSQMSLDAARNAGVAISDKPKRSLLASLFGMSGDEDEDTETASTPAPAPASKVSPPARTVTASVASVPLPMARPVIREAEPAAGENSFALASASSKPVQLGTSAPAGEASAGENVFVARGMWEGPQGRPEPPAAIPEPAPVEVASAGPVDVPALGPTRPAGEPQGSDIDPTGAVTAWLEKTSPANTSPDKASGADRVPADIAFAYAAQNDSLVATPVTRAAPMGAAAGRTAPAASDLDIATSVVKKALQRPAVAALPLSPPVATAPVKPAAVAPGARYEDPWLRALILAPDLQNYLTLTAFVAADPRQLRTLMHKPNAVVMMTFSNDPYFGMTSERFSGSAVYFVSTVTFSNRTAMLR